MLAVSGLYADMFSKTRTEPQNTVTDLNIPATDAIATIPHFSLRVYTLYGFSRSCGEGPLSASLGTTQVKSMAWLHSKKYKIRTITFIMVVCTVCTVPILINKLDLLFLVNRTRVVRFRHPDRRAQSRADEGGRVERLEFRSLYEDTDTHVYRIAALDPFFSRHNVTQSLSCTPIGLSRRNVIDVITGVAGCFGRTLIAV